MLFFDKNSFLTTSSWIEKCYCGLVSKQTVCYFSLIHSNNKILIIITDLIKALKHGLIWDSSFGCTNRSNQHYSVIVDLSSCFINRVYLGFKKHDSKWFLFTRLPQDKKHLIYRWWWYWNPETCLKTYSKLSRITRLRK